MPGMQNIKATVSEDHLFAGLLELADLAGNCRAGFNSCRHDLLASLAALAAANYANLARKRV